jgi:hypothetical protein
MRQFRGSHRLRLSGMAFLEYQAYHQLSSQVMSKQCFTSDAFGDTPDTPWFHAPSRFLAATDSVASRYDQ